MSDRDQRVFTAPTLSESSVHRPSAHPEELRQLETPEKRLMAAVLVDAVHRLHNPLFARRRRGYPLNPELEWLLSDDREWPFSFANICDVLDLDAAWLRQRILEHVQRARLRAFDTSSIVVSVNRKGAAQSFSESRDGGEAPFAAKDFHRSENLSADRVPLPARRYALAI